MKTGLVFSGGIEKVADPLSTVVLVGDSIHWGYNLQTNNTIAYYMQKRINESYDYTPATWGLGNDIVARSITTDDVSNKTSFGGGTTGVLRHITGSGNITNPTIGMVPFSANTNSSVGGSVTGISGWNNGGIQLGANTGSGAGKLTFTVNYPDNIIGLNAYLNIKAMGQGHFKVTRVGADGTNPYYFGVGGAIYGQTTSGSNSFYITYNQWLDYIYPSAARDQPKVDSYVYASGFPTGPNALRISSIPTAFPNYGYFKSNAPLSITSKFDWHAAHPIDFKIGPFFLDGSNFTQNYTIEYYPSSYSTISNGAATITGIHPFTRSPSSMPIVQIHARNNYGITDYYAAAANTVTRAATIIRQNTFSNPSFAESADPLNKYATYILCCGIFNIIDDSSSRQLTPTQYYTALSNLATNLKTCPSKGDLEGYLQWIPDSNVRVILSIPPTPIGWTPPTGYTFGDYKRQIINLANNLGLSYIDLSSVITSSADYQADGLHPNAAGAEKIAKRYINMLQLLQI